MASPDAQAAHPARAGSTERDEPLFETTGGCIVRGGARLLELGRHAIFGRGLVIAFEHAALAHLLLGRATLEDGGLRFSGHEPKGALSSGRLGLQPAQLSWEGDFTVEGALSASASLAGSTPSDARRTLTALRLAPRRSARIDKLTALERRLLTLAAALVTEPDVVLLDRPFLTLDDAGAQLLETVLAQQLATRRFIALLDLQSPWERRLCARADAGVLVARAGQLLGPFSAEEWLEKSDVFWVRAGGEETRWSGVLSEAGGQVAEGPAPGTLIVRGLSGRTIAALCAKAGVLLHELAPLGHAPPDRGPRDQGLSAGQDSLGR